MTNNKIPWDTFILCCSCVVQDKTEHDLEQALKTQPIKILSSCIKKDCRVKLWLQHSARRVLLSEWRTKTK